jgi:hypothetical protein
MVHCANGEKTHRLANVNPKVAIMKPIARVYENYDSRTKENIFIGNYLAFSKRMQFSRNNESLHYTDVL